MEAVQTVAEAVEPGIGKVSFRLTRGELFGIILRLAMVGVTSYFGIRWIVNAMDPTRKQKQEAKQQAEQLMRTIGVKGVRLSDYEMSIAAQLIDPGTLSIGWEDIGGLESLCQEIKETILLPLKKRHLFDGSALMQPPKGVLLYGPPGCGKTMIAKAIAKDAGCRFINLQGSCLKDKWYGESEKLASAVFTLARKLQPAIIFIDEIDSFLRLRATSDHETTAMMKAQFMTFWDGLVTDNTCEVIVMGATNRPQDVDAAILRRMPTSFHIKIPDRTQRERILRILLQQENVNPDVDLAQLAAETEGFSGSDLRELCRNACVYIVRDYMRGSGEGEATPEEVADQLRPLQMEDLKAALLRLKESKQLNPLSIIDMTVD